VDVGGGRYKRPKVLFSSGRWVAEVVGKGCRVWREAEVGDEQCQSMECHPHALSADGIRT
nr:hypothetical protein [Tanacetum cinerariifolium]